MSVQFVVLCSVIWILALPVAFSFLHAPTIGRTRLGRYRTYSMLSDIPSRLEQVHTAETMLNQKIYKMDQSVVPGAAKREKCIIVGVDKTLRLQLQTTEELSTMESLTEMMELCKTANLRIVGSCVQRMSVPNPKSYLGEGKMNELRELCKLSGAQVIVVDDDISPRQQRCLEQALAKSAVQSDEEEEGEEEEGSKRSNSDEETETGEDEETADSNTSLITRLRQKSSLQGKKPSKQPKKVDFQPKKDFSAIKVLDRTAIILDIFAQHAQSREGQLQVELAMMEYRSTRGPNVASSSNGNSDNTVGDGKGSSGAGLRGPGESKLELDKRKIKTRILLLKDEIAKLQLQRQAQRSGRVRLGVPIVALVGYTNAGKSTILNRLSKAGVLAENILFATLDPTTRKIRLPPRSADSTDHLPVYSENQDISSDADVDSDAAQEGETSQGMEVLLTDTVGFISKLPSSVVAAFRATLESVADADVLVHVCDRSSPSWEKQRAVVLQELARIAEKSQRRVPIVEFWNKVDALPAEVCEQIQNEIRSIPIEMDIVSHASNDLPHAPPSYTQSTPTNDRATVLVEKPVVEEVDDELYMCASLPDNSSIQRKFKKQTKNQKRNKDRFIATGDAVSEAPRKEQVFKVAFDTTVNTPFENPHHQLQASSAAAAAALGSTSSPLTPSTSSPPSAHSGMLQVEPSKHLVYTAAGSARTGAGIDTLVARVEDALSLQFVATTLHIPYAADAGVTSSIRLRGVVSDVRYDDSGVSMTCRLPTALAESLAKYKVKEYL